MSHSQPIRVLYCIDRLLAGGTEKQLMGLVRALDRRVVEPHVCTLVPGEINPATLGCPAIELGIHSLRSTSLFQVWRRYRDFLREAAVDVVHTFFQDATFIAQLFSVRTAVRARVVSFRDLGFWRTRAKVVQMRTVYPLVDRFVANSKAVATAFQRADHLSPVRFTVIYNGMDVPAGPPTPRPPEAPLVCCVANFDRPVKRIDLFIDVAGVIARSRPDVRFVVVGDGPARASLAERARGQGLGETLQFTGRLDDVGEVLRRASVGIVPSDSEGFSNAVLEYMAAGVACVARDVGGNREVVEHRRNGMLVEGDDPRHLAAAALALLDDRGLAASVVAAAYVTVSTRFSWGAAARAHEDLYRSLLGER